MSGEGGETPKGTKPPLSISTTSKKGGTDPAKIKETLSRLRAKREESGGIPDGGPSVPSTPTPLDSNSARKQLQSWRAKSRENSMSASAGEDGLRRSLGRQGPRSPLKSTSRLRGQSFGGFNDEEGDEDAEEEEGNGKGEIDEEDDTYVPIMKIQPADHVFPLSFVPKSRTSENELQRVVLVPAPLELQSDMANICVKGLHRVCGCVSCCGSHDSMLGTREFIGEMVHHERDFLSTADNYKLFQWVDSQKVTAPELIEYHEQLTVWENTIAGVANGNKSSGPTNQRNTNPTSYNNYPTNRENYEESDELDPFFDPAAARLDGLFNGNPPVLAHALLESERVPSAIAKLSASHLQLSRATQRLLRELVGSMENIKLRQKWQQMNKSGASAGSGAGAAVKSEEGKSAHSSDPTLVRPEVPPEVHLLTQLNTAPVLHIIENPVAGGSTQPLMPKTALSYGGQIPQYGSEGSVTDRVGALPRGWSGRRGGARAKFKLHLYQLCFTEHPLISVEERALVNLKAMYAQYRGLFEQKILEYLTQRLLSLTTILHTMLSRIDAPSVQNSTDKTNKPYTEEDLLLLKGVYRDLIETLPALNKLNDAVDALSSSVYEGWREIQDYRLRTGITHTTAELTVRRVNSNLVAPHTNHHNNNSTGGHSRFGRRHPAAGGNSGIEEEGEGGGDSGGEESNGAGAFWNTLKANLERTPSLLKKAQRVLFQPDTPAPQEVDLMNALPAESVGSRGNESPRAALMNDEQRAKQAGYDRVVQVVSRAVEQLIQNNGLIPRYALRLTESGHVTPDNMLPPAELKRRATLKAMCVKAVVKFNGRVVTSTEYYPLRVGSMSIDFNKFFEFRVLHQPSDVTIDLYTSKVHSWDPTETFLATISVPFPAQSSSTMGNNRAAIGGNGGGAAGAGKDVNRHQHVAHSYVPTSGWYHFTCQMSDTANGLHRRSEGAVLCTAEYDVTSTDPAHGNNNTTEGVRVEDIALIPVPKPTLRSATHARDGKTQDFSREADFQQLLPDLEDIDVNDPDNDHLLYLKGKRPVTDESAAFRLYGDTFGVVFHTEDGHLLNNYVRFKETPRMKLLQLRCVKPYLFNAPIPLNEAVIKHSELYKTIFAQELHETMARVGTGPDGPYSANDDALTDNKVSVNKSKVSNFLQRVRSSQTAMSRKKKRKNYVTSSVVVETDYISMEELELLDLFERRRSLHPKVKVRTPVSVQLDKCELLVQVVGAKNIPLRSEHDPLAGMGTSLGAGAGLSGVSNNNIASTTSSNNLNSSMNRRSRARSSSGAAALNDEDAPIVSEHMLDERKLKEKRRARTFVEVRFQENAVCTSAMDGGTPMWRESLSLPFRAPQDDFSPASLEQVREDVYFTLFDEVIEDDSERGGLLEGESPFRVERRYLGSFSVPFETIYTEGRVEGVFRLDTPAINFGYDHAASGVTRREKQQSNMFEGTEEAEAEANRIAESDRLGTNGSIWSTFMRLLECLSQTNSVLSLKHPDDNLYYRGSHIHQDTQSEFSYFASDDVATYVKVLITLDPVLTVTPTVLEDIVLSNMIQDDRGIGAYARGWLKAIKSIGPHTNDRNYKLFGTNSSGMSVFICRFLTAQSPPKGYDSRRSCVHLISNIPFMNDVQSFIGELDLWCTCSQFWEIGAGDEEEHAVTLFNYLYYLALKRGTVTNITTAGAGAGAGAGQSNNNKSNNKNTGKSDVTEALRESVFLVMGRAVPEGDSVYVMIRDFKRSAYGAGPENFLIINPWTGYIYSANDPNCPLRDVYLLATPNNIWANIQVSARPSELSFDLLNVSLWRPFFGSRYPLPTGGLNTVQTDIEYVETSPGYALEIEKAVFQSIRNRIRKWRSKRQRSTTTFHPDACSVMHDLLPKLENWKRSGNPEAFENGNNDTVPADQTAALAELQRLAQDKMKSLLRTRTLRGFPLNVPFTDVEELLTKIKTMGIHEAKHPEVQFVMAVRAFPLYNNILSLWVFLGTLEPIVGH